MKTYCNRADRNDLLFLAALMGQSECIAKQLKGRITSESESAQMLDAAGMIQKVLEEVIKRMEFNNRGFAAQLLRDSKRCKLQLYIPDLDGNYMENKGENITVSKTLLSDLLNETAIQCLGCNKNQDDCPYAKLRDMVDTAPVNGNSDVCPYRLSGEEMEIL